MTWTAEAPRTATVRDALRPAVRSALRPATPTARAESAAPSTSAPAAFPHAGAAPIDLTPVSARAAVGRYTGLSRSRPARPAPFWRSAGIVGLVALIAAAATPIIAQILTVSG